MTIFAIILLIVLGLVLLLIEFAVIPGITVAGIGGFVLLALSVYIAFSEYGNTIGFVTLGFVLVAAPMLMYYFFKSKSGKKMILETSILGNVGYIDNEKILVGDTGKTVGRLAPGGKVKINGELFEAQSLQGFVDQNTEVKVLKILNNKIIVEPVKKEQK